MKQNVESADLSKCARAKESAHVLVPQQELEVHKMSSDAGINRITRALLKRITRRDFPFPKPHLTKSGKRAVSTCKEVSNIAGREVTSSQDNMPGNGSSFLTKVENVTTRDFLRVPSKTPMVPASLNPVNCNNLTSMRNDGVPSTLPVESTSVKPLSMVKYDIEAPTTISQAEEDVGQSSKVDSGLHLLHQTKSAYKKHGCDKQECGAISVSSTLEEAQKIIASNVTLVEPVSIVTPVTALHSKEASHRKTFEESGTSSLPSHTKLSDEEAATLAKTEALCDQSGSRVADTSKNVSVVPLTNGKVLSGCLNSSSNGEHVEEPVQPLILKQKGVSKATIPLSGQVERTSSHVSVPAETTKDGLMAQSNKAMADKPTADQNQTVKDFSSNVNSLPDVSPEKRVHCAVNRSVPMASGGGQAVNCVPGVKGPCFKKVRYAIDEGDHMDRDIQRGLLSIGKDLKDDGFHARHQDENYERSDSMDKPSSFKLREPSLAGSNFDVIAMKRDHHANDFRCRMCDTGSYKGVCMCNRYKAGFSKEFFRAKSNDKQREWKENDSQEFLN
ncbi:hypothetical protein L7F22_050346 [Adiantum nelumboides]|nr:hypothetical protein [Adiantum nelumboides]